MVSVKVKAYATLRDHLPSGTKDGQRELGLEDGATIADVCEELGIPKDRVAIAIVNGRQKDIDHELDDGDEVALFPGIAGG